MKEFSIIFDVTSDNIHIRTELPNVYTPTEISQVGERIAYALNQLFSGNSNELIQTALSKNRRTEISAAVLAKLEIKDLMSSVVSPLEVLD